MREAPTFARQAADKADRYERLAGQARALVADEPDWLANLANVAAAVYAAIPGLNWAGFYLMRDGGLVVGPFQGLPACTRIAVGRGVCGTAAAERRTIVVDDVRAFAGHIACDPSSRSEIVVPILDNGLVVAVLDLDSDRPAHFDDGDRAGLERLVAEVAPSIDWARAAAS